MRGKVHQKPARPEAIDEIDRARLIMSGAIKPLRRIEFHGLFRNVPRQALLQVGEMIGRGLTNAEICRETGVQRPYIRRLHCILTQELGLHLPCSCGKAWGHKGICQAVMARTGFVPATRRKSSIQIAA